jgi:hypothetical protein
MTERRQALGQLRHRAGGALPAAAPAPIRDRDAAGGPV